MNVTSPLPPVSETSKNEPLPLAVSMGDPCGIGPDIILQAWSEQREKLPRFNVIGSSKILQRRAQQLGLDVEITRLVDNRVSGAGLPVLDIDVSAEGIPATPEAADAHLTLEAIKTGVNRVQSGFASALVTCPINKKTLYDVGFNHPGHTEFLAELSVSGTGKPPMPVMMLAGPDLRTVPVTIHIPLDQVPDALTTDLIVKTCRIVHHDLRDRFHINEPRLALAGLNPHAGENGALGLQEKEVIQPAVQQLLQEGLAIKGPLPADTMFHESARTRYDVAICMYHDQALIPAKMLGFDDAVNVTLGLPFIRTSPDHGTAYDIAGSGKANPSSFIAALNLASEMAMSAQTPATAS